MASRSINKVQLLGNLTRDPELKYTPAGTAVCTFGIATNRSWVTADGQTKEDTQFHRLVAWQKLAELCAKLLKKGSKTLIEGRITYRDYTDKSGQQRFVTEIVVDDFYALDSKRSDVKGDSMTATEQKQADHAQQSHADAPPATEEHESKSRDIEVNVDDIPF